MAKKENNSKLIKVYEGGQFKTELWWNDKTKQFDIWRNKKVVERLSYDLQKVNIATKICDDWYEDTEHANMTLNEYLKRNNIQLTKIEIDTLECILGEGSFYEESASYIKNEDTDEYSTPYVERKYGTFIGWYIDESECPGCRGALSSLVKKGILSIAYDDSYGEGPQAMYYIYFTPEFLPECQGYHKLKIDEGNRK